jgi:hypothetical protein
MTTRAKSTRNASLPAGEMTAVHGTSQALSDRVPKLIMFLSPATILGTDSVEADNLPPTTSSSVQHPPRRQVQPRKPRTAKPISLTPPDAARRGPGRPRKQPVGSPAVAEPTPAPARAPPLVRPPSPSSPFISETSSNPVDATVTALPPRAARLSSDGNHSTYSHNQSDDEYRPDDESGEEDLAEELAKILIDDNLDCGTITASEGLASVLQDKSGPSSSSASDVWYFMISASSTPPDGQKEHSPGSYERPSGEFLDCYLCRYGTIPHFLSHILILPFSLRNKSRRFTNGVTTAMRRHLRSEHMREWLVSCVSLKLKGWEEKAAELRKLPAQAEDSDLTRSVLTAIQPAWSLKGFLDLLIKWIVVDDQVCMNFSGAGLY